MIDDRWETTVPGHVRVPVAARLIGRSTLEVYLLIEDGELHPVRDPKGMIVVPEAELETFR